MKQYSECGGCGLKEVLRLLHTVRHRGNYRRLCTSCVLKHHVGSFCPHCFQIYEGFTPPIDRVACLKCDSPSHLVCVGRDVVTSYMCPSCLNPAHVYFDVGGVGGGELNNNNKTTSKDGEEEEDGQGSSSNNNHIVMEFNSSKVFLAAAQFASVSMKKAAYASKIEADKRVKEAWSTRKKAREALQEFYTVALKKPKKDGKESMMIQPIPSPVAVEEPMKKTKGNSAVAAAVAAQKRIQNQASMAVIDGKVRPIGIHAPHVLPQRPPINGAPASAAVVNNDKLKVSPATVMGNQQFRNAATVNVKEKSLNISQLRINDAKVENENNGLLLVPKTEGLLQHLQINHPIKEDPDEVKEFEDSRMFPQLTQSNEGSTDAFIPRNNEGVLHPGSSKTMS